MKVYDIRRTDRRTPSDGKSSHGLWPGELKRQTIHWLKEKRQTIHWLKEKRQTIHWLKETRGSQEPV